VSFGLKSEGRKERQRHLRDGPLRVLPHSSFTFFYDPSQARKKTRQVSLILVNLSGELTVKASQEVKSHSTTVFLFLESLWHMGTWEYMRLIPLAMDYWIIIIFFGYGQAIGNTIVGPFHFHFYDLEGCKAKCTVISWISEKYRDICGNRTQDHIMHPKNRWELNPWRNH